MNPNMMGGPPGAGGHGYDSGMGPPGMGPPGMDMGMGMGGMGMERIFPAIKLRGLPFDVSEDDIRMFIVRTGRSDSTLSINHDLTFLPCIFVQGCDPVDILMVRRDGRLSGEAFVVLSSPMHVEVGLSKNRTYLGRRYIEVYRAKKIVSTFTLPVQANVLY